MKKCVCDVRTAEVVVQSSRNSGDDSLNTGSSFDTAVAAIYTTIGEVGEYIYVDVDD